MATNSSTSFRPTISTTISTTKNDFTTIRTTTQSTILTTAASITTTTMTTPQSSSKFPYPIAVIVLAWFTLGFVYIISKWRQKGKVQYIIPRVFVLCSPRTVQFHYELILRIGLPSYDFNPEKHDIDLTVLGQQKNEVVPMTRLNTKTILDEPLITSLSIVIYRLVELPPLGALILKHSGPFKSWIYAYDFTIIDLSTNREQYYTLNQYIGSLDRILALEEPVGNNINYPIDDVPLPKWVLEDIYLVVFTTINAIMLITALMPINCTYTHDILAIFLTGLGGGALLSFLQWLIHYNLRWNHDRKEFFNDYSTHKLMLGENVIKVIIAIIAVGLGGGAIYFVHHINDWKDSLVWLLAFINSCTLVIGIWNACRQVDIGEYIVGLGLKLRRVDLVYVGMKFSEMSSNLFSKSGSASDDGSGSKLAVNIGPRSSVKSFGFDPVTGHPSHKMFSRLVNSRLSSTGATPNNHPTSRILKVSASGRHRIAQPITKSPQSNLIAHNPNPVHTKMNKQRSNVNETSKSSRIEPSKGKKIK